MNYGEDDCASVSGSFGTFVEQLGYVVRTRMRNMGCNRHDVYRSFAVCTF